MIIEDWRDHDVCVMMCVDGEEKRKKRKKKTELGLLLLILEVGAHEI